MSGEQKSVKNQPAPWVKSRTKKIRLKREDSVWVYAILEGHEGVCNYSTLPFEKGAGYLDMSLSYTPEFEGQLEDILRQMGDKIYELT
ncbi:DUF4911 domain-containing protein [Bdellovibrionota bacterium FG-1]